MNILEEFLSGKCCISAWTCAHAHALHTYNTMLFKDFAESELLLFHPLFNFVFTNKMLYKFFILVVVFLPPPLSLSFNSFNCWVAAIHFDSAMQLVHGARICYIYWVMQRNSNKRKNQQPRIEERECEYQHKNCVGMCWWIDELQAIRNSFALLWIDLLLFFKFLVKRYFWFHKTSSEWTRRYTLIANPLSSIYMKFFVNVLNTTHWLELIELWTPKHEHTYSLKCMYTTQCCTKYTFLNAQFKWRSCPFTELENQP